MHNQMSLPGSMVLGCWDFCILQTSTDWLERLSASPYAEEYKVYAFGPLMVDRLRLHEAKGITDLDISQTLAMTKMQTSKDQAMLAAW